jgi:hypothetical protein
MVSTARANPVAVDELIRELATTNDPRRLEILAGLLGAARDPRAITPLLVCLASVVVQRNECAEEAVCAALHALAVMRRFSNGRYALLPAHDLDQKHVDLVRELGAAVPMRYFFAPAQSPRRAPYSLTTAVTPISRST